MNKIGQGFQGLKLYILKTFKIIVLLCVLNSFYRGVLLFGVKVMRNDFSTLRA